MTFPSLHELKKLADRGNALAAYDLALCYLYGHDAPKDIIAARRYLKRAKNLGLCLPPHLEAEIAPLPEPTPDPQQLFTLALADAMAGNPTAMMIMGHYSETGFLVDPDMALAKTWYAKAAEAGSFFGHQALLRLALNEGNIADIRKHAFPLAQNGDPEAMLFMAKALLIPAADLETNPLEAALWLNRAVAMSYLPAYVSLAAMYISKLPGVPFQPLNAHNLLFEAFAEGYAQEALSAVSSHMPALLHQMGAHAEALMYATNLRQPSAEMGYITQYGETTVIKAQLMLRAYVTRRAAALRGN